MQPIKKNTDGSIEVFCPTCNQSVILQLPSDLITPETKRFPVTYRFIHGDPPHSVTLYIDAHYNVRGFEFNDKIDFSKELINWILKNNSNSSMLSNNEIIKKMLQSILSYLVVNHEGNEKLLYDLGYKIGIEIAPSLIGESVGEILDSLKDFWAENELGRIIDAEVKISQITFNVSDCFECAFMPNIGKTVCHLDEGILSGIFTEKMKKSYKAVETECYAKGFDHCRFEITPTTQ